MHKNIMEHGDNLNVIFGLDVDKVKLCKSLRRIETALTIPLERYCNGEIDEKEITRIENNKLKLLGKLIGEHNLKMIFINRDPRGYALKIHSELSKDMKIYRDFGGYGIIAPDFN